MGTARRRRPLSGLLEPLFLTGIAIFFLVSNGPIENYLRSDMEMRNSVDPSPKFGPLADRGADSCAGRRSAGLIPGSLRAIRAATGVRGLTGGGDSTGGSGRQVIDLSAGGLQRVVGDRMLNFIFVGGKGGVGKTTVSSALSIQRAKTCAEEGLGDVLLLSTDPAHSLSDAFKMNFTGEPTKVPGVKGLWVMEIDPAKTIAKEISAWAELAKKAGLDDFMGEFNKFQSWLTSLPGIDEASALAAALERIKTKEFGTIVFDTAPTGHTVKLLGLPDVLQRGIDKLSTVSNKIMMYLNSFRNLFNPNADQTPNVQQALVQKLQKYKESVQVVGLMLKDQTRTNFVIVCIAEYLSVMESRRLVQDLKLHGISNTHIVVNQLVQGAPTDQDIKDLAPVLDKIGLTQRARLRKCMKLMGAREAIQKKYLSVLASADELENVTLVPMPLLPEEVTGVEKLEEFSQLLQTGVDDSNIHMVDDQYGYGAVESEEVIVSP